MLFERQDGHFGASAASHGAKAAETISGVMAHNIEQRMRSDVDNPATKPFWPAVSFAFRLQANTLPVADAGGIFIFRVFGVSLSTIPATLYDRSL